MTESTSSSARTQEDVRARLAMLDAEIEALTAKHDALAQRAADCTRRAAALQREITEAQLGELPDESALKDIRGMLVDAEADARTAGEGARAIARSLDELALGRKALDADVRVLEFNEAITERDAADEELGDALLEVTDIVAPVRARFDAKQARCQSALLAASAALRAAGRESLGFSVGEDRVNRSGVSAPAWQAAGRVLDLVTGIREARGLCDPEHPAVYLMAGVDAIQRMAAAGAFDNDIRAPRGAWPFTR